MKLKNIVILLAVMIIVGAVILGFKKDKVEDTNNVVQQNTQIENQTEDNESQIDNDTQGENKNEVDKNTQVNTDTQIDSENQQVDNNVDNTVDNNKEETNIETTNKTISEQEALNICKSKLSGKWNDNYLMVGSNESGDDKIININNKIYYAIYYVNEELDTIADFRFLVDKASGDVFYQSPEDLSKLVPIDEYNSNN